MKTNKIFKTAIAMVLALILSFGTMTAAFAAETGETVKWVENGEDYEYIHLFTYRGAVTEGQNEISLENISYDTDECYSFDAEKAGYYLFTYSNFSFNLSEKVVDGKPYNYATGLYGYNADVDDYTMVYLPEGAVYLGINNYCDALSGNLEIEYIGAEIVDIEFDESDFENLIIDYDFGYGTGNGFDIVCDPTFVFENGRETAFENAYIRFTTEGEVEEGENVIITANTFGVEKQLTMTCYPLSHFIEKVEISNLDKYLKVRQYYIDGDVSYDFYGSPEDEDGIQGETLTVTLSDGTTQSYPIIWNDTIQITLQNGRKVYVYCSDERYNGKHYFVFVVGGQVFIEEECEVIEADDKDNAERLEDRIDLTVSCMKRNLSFWFSELVNPQHGYSFSEIVLHILKEIHVKLGGVLGEIRDYITHTVLN